MDPKFKDLTGQVFGRLTVIRFDHIDRRNTKARYMWLVSCECGNETIVERSLLKSGNTKSCGCLHKESVTRHGAKGHPLFIRCDDIIRRCISASHANYHNYGGRGITVHEAWKNDLLLMCKEIEALIGLPPFRGAEIDRIDNSKGYEPLNIRWVDHETNTRNRRCSHDHAIDPVTKKPTPTYNSWINCCRRNEVCDEWKSDHDINTDNGFKNFLKDMGERPVGSRIARLNRSKPHGPNNTYWR